MQNLNNILTEKYNNDFNTALNIYENAYSHDYLIELLKNGSIVEKQAATLKLDKIDTKEEAKIFINNLTGCDGKIREAVSFRLKEFIPSNPELFEEFSEILLDAVIDINGNICRNTIEAIKNLKNNHKFTNKFCKMLSIRTLDLIEPIKKFDFQDGKYKINKEVFKLYWYLETICEFFEYIEKNSLIEILQQTKNIQEYTIREKTAKILSKIKNIPELSVIKSELKNDANYYVRRF